MVWSVIIVGRKGEKMVWNGKTGKNGQKVYENAPSGNSKVRAARAKGEAGKPTENLATWSPGSAALLADVLRGAVQETPEEAAARRVIIDRGGYMDRDVRNQVSSKPVSDPFVSVALHDVMGGHLDRIGTLNLLDNPHLDSGNLVTVVNGLDTRIDRMMTDGSLYRDHEPGGEDRIEGYRPTWEETQDEVRGPTWQERECLQRAMMDPRFPSEKVDSYMSADWDGDEHQVYALANPGVDKEVRDDVLGVIVNGQWGDYPAGEAVEEVFSSRGGLEMSESLGRAMSDPTVPEDTRAGFVDSMMVAYANSDPESGQGMATRNRVLDSWRRMWDAGAVPDRCVENAERIVHGR